MTQFFNFPSSSQNSPEKSLLRAFIEKFTGDEFFKDLIRVILYPADFGTIHSQKTTDYINDFLISIRKIITTHNIPFNRFEHLDVIKSLLAIRESSLNILSYDNVTQHITPKSTAVSRLIQLAVQERLNNADEFRELKTKILNEIQAYYEIVSVSSNLVLIDNLTNTISSDDVNVFEMLKLYKDTIMSAYSDLSKLQTVNKEESLSDYFIITNKDSTKKLSETITKYILSDYSFFKTGYDLFDASIDGFESSSVHIISAPSNHGKSIFLVNLLNSIVRENLDSFEENDVILFVTLEDDIYKLFRRFASILGNYNYTSVKRIFKVGYELSKNATPDVKYKFEQINQNLINASILSATKEKIGLVIKHCNENTFSPGDLGRFIDQIKMVGYNVKLVFADYIDVFSPTVQKYSSYNDYDNQGIIVQELRNLSRIYKVPIVTATQNKRESEKLNSVLSNDQVGDSYKKIRYSDYIYMCRQRTDLDPFVEPVASFVFPDLDESQPQEKYLKNKQLISDNLIPFEVKITKAKDGEKGKTRYFLLCKQNIRLYNTVDEYLNDLNQLQINSTRLSSDIDALSQLVFSDLSVTSSDDSPFDNIEDINVPF